jgi:hypothetical protein
VKRYEIRWPALDPVLGAEMAKTRLRRLITEMYGE